MTGDERIRAALEGIAELAPAPDRLRASLHGRIRAYRQRRALVLTGATVAAVGAAGVPAALLLRDRRPNRRPPVRPNVPTPPPEPTGTGNIRVPMRLRPTWLPEQMVELMRGAERGGAAQSRVWATPAAIEAMRAGDLERVPIEGTVSLVIRRELPPPTPVSPWPTESPPAPPLTRPPANAMVGDRPAWLSAPLNGPADLEWYIDDGLLVELGVSAIPGAGEIVRTVADSLVPDTVGGCETSLRFGWLPELAGQVWDIQVDGYGGGWVQSLRALPVRTVGYEPVWAQLATSRDLLSGLTDGDPVTLRGRPGFARIGGGYGEAAVPLDGGRWLRVLCYLDSDGAHERDCAVRVANELIIGPDPYLDWIGRR